MSYLNINFLRVLINIYEVMNSCKNFPNYTIGTFYGLRSIWYNWNFLENLNLKAQMIDFEFKTWLFVCFIHCSHVPIYTIVFIFVYLGQICLCRHGCILHWPMIISVTLLYHVFMFTLLACKTDIWQFYTDVYRFENFKWPLLEN